MISKAQIKNIRLLHQKKHRDEAGLFIAEGPKVVEELLNSPFRVKDVFATKEFIAPASFKGVKVQEVNEKEMGSISALMAPNQVLAVFEAEEALLDLPALKSELVLALDDIRDPGNLGTIIRIADWFGIRHILCSQNCVDVFNPKVIQATMGSIARVQLNYVDLEDVLFQFDTVYAAVLNGASIYSQRLVPKGVLLIGNESKGISEKLMKRVTRKVSIPRFSNGAESLNAAVATAVICSEFRRGGGGPIIVR